MTTPRCYLRDDLLGMLKLSRSSFNGLKAAGKLPFLEELRPRIGRHARYRADLVDRYLAGEWGRSTAFAAARRAAR